MKYRELAVIDALQRAQSWLTEHKAEFADVKAADFGRMEKKVDEVLTRLMMQGVDQDLGDRGSKGETAKQRQLRLDLRAEWMKPIAVIARRNLRTAPEFKALQLPRASTVGQGFIASARGMAAAAVVHREALVGYGLPESFVEDLEKAVDEFEASLAERDRNRIRRVGATKGLETETQEARTVLAVLDARVRRWAKENETLQRKWESARLIRRRPGPVSVAAGSATSDGSEASPPNELPLAAA